MYLSGGLIHSVYGSSMSIVTPNSFATAAVLPRSKPRRSSNSGWCVLSTIVSISSLLLLFSRSASRSSLKSLRSVAKLTSVRYRKNDFNPAVSAFQKCCDCGLNNSIGSNPSWRENSLLPKSVNPVKNSGMAGPSSASLPAPVSVNSATSTPSQSSSRRSSSSLSAVFMHSGFCRSIR